MSTHLPAKVSANRLSTSLRSPNAAEVPSRRTVHQRRPRLERVTCLAYAPGVLAAGGGQVCCVWNTRTQQLLHRIVLDAAIGAVWIARDRTALAIAAGTDVALYDIATGERRLACTHLAEVVSVHIGNVAEVLASADVAGRIQVRELPSGRLIRDLPGPPGRPVVFAYRGRYILIGADTHSLIVDAATGETLRRFPYDSREPIDLKGLRLDTTLVAHSGTKLRWFDCSRYAPAYCVRDLGATIRSMDIYESGRSRLALAATENDALHVFDLSSGDPRACYHSFTIPLMFARFGPGGSLYVAGGEALVMHLVEGQHVRSYLDESPPLVAMAAQPDRESFLLSNRDGGVAQVSLRDGRRHRSFAGHSGSVSVVACDSRSVATGAYDGTVRLLDANLHPLATIDLAQGPVQSIALDVTAHELWAGTWRGKVNRVDLESREITLTTDAFSSSVRTLAIDRARQRLCAGGDAGELCLFDLKPGMKRIFEQHQPGPVYRAAFSADGDLWTTSGDGVRRYSAADPMQQVTFPGTLIRWFELADDKLFVLSLSGTLTVFDVASRSALHSTVIESPVSHRSVVALAPDRIATASADGLVRVFDAQLRLVASLELLRDGFLWSTPPVGAHPGWLHTDRPELVDVGEPREAGLEVFARNDARRARHLAVFHSATHVLRIVAGETASSNSIRPPPGGYFHLASTVNWLQSTPASRRGGDGPSW